MMRSKSHPTTVFTSRRMALEKVSIHQLICWNTGKPKDEHFVLALTPDKALMNGSVRFEFSKDRNLGWGFDFRVLCRRYRIRKFLFVRIRDCGTDLFISREVEQKIGYHESFGRGMEPCNVFVGKTREVTECNIIRYQLAGNFGEIYHALI